MSSSVRQAMQILELLVDNPEGTRVTDIADRLGVNKAVPHRILQVLVETGYVSQHEVTERYTSTLRVAAMGLRQLGSTQITEWAHEPLHRLARTTGELVRMAALVAGDLVWISRARGTRETLEINAELGRRAPFHASSVGKAWLSTLSDSELEDFVERLDLERFTEATIVDRDELRNEIRRARELGFAVIKGEHVRGIVAIGAPVRTRSHENGGYRAVGAVAIVSPDARNRVEQLEKFLPSLMEAVEEIGSNWPVYQHIRDGRLDDSRQSAFL